MALQLRWVGESEYERVAQTRMLCYGPGTNSIEKYRRSVSDDHRQRPGDFLLAERDGRAIGTATSIELVLHARGSAFKTQGVAYVGTIRTHRRGGTGGEKGVASQVMLETLRRARETGCVLSALMPFRNSFYEHFGYGTAERRCEWIVPLSILPRGDFAGFRPYEPTDLAAVKRLRQREVQAGHCDIETTDAAWEYWMRFWPEGFVVVDETAPGELAGMMHFGEERTGAIGSFANTGVLVHDWCAVDFPAFVRMLHMLASLKDQYTYAKITLPGDVRLEKLLRESQLPHRPVEHAVASARPFTRMQVRVLDHKSFLEGLHLPESTRGSVGVRVIESDGEPSTLRIEFDSGRASVSKSAAKVDLEISDSLWASIVTGDTPAGDALRMGLIHTTPAVASLLDAFSAGRTPFCQEYF